MAQLEAHKLASSDGAHGGAVPEWDETFDAGDDTGTLVDDPTTRCLRLHWHARQLAVIVGGPSSPALASTGDTLTAPRSPPVPEVPRPQSPSETPRQAAARRISGSWPAGRSR
jgi:hypothetical protein